MLELYYKFSKKFRDTKRYEELEMDTGSLFLALSEENLEDNFLPEKINEWEAIRSWDCTYSFTANATGNFFPRTCCTAHKKHNKGEPGPSEEEFRCSEMLCLCSKTYCCYDRNSNRYKFSSKGINEKTLEDCADGPMSHVKVWKSVRRGSQRYFNQQRISRNLALQPTNRQKRIVLFLPKTSCRRGWNTY